MITRLGLREEFRGRVLAAAVPDRALPEAAVDDFRKWRRFMGEAASWMMGATASREERQVVGQDKLQLVRNGLNQRRKLEFDILEFQRGGVAKVRFEYPGNELRDQIGIRE